MVGGGPMSLESGRSRVGPLRRCPGYDQLYIVINDLYSLRSKLLEVSLFQFNQNT